MSAKRKLETSSSEDEEMNAEDVTSDENDDDDDDEDNRGDSATRAPTQEEQQSDEKINESGGAGPEARGPPYKVERIVEHGRASEMAAKFKDHRRIATLDRDCTNSLREWGEADDTFQPESTLRGDDVFEDYVRERNFPDPGRCLMPTDKTMELVRYRMRQGGRAVEYAGPLEAAANDIDTHFPGGQRAAKALQASFQSEARRLKKQKKKVPEWRLVYMHLDASILCPSAANSHLRPLDIFGQAAFYIGKGTVKRPFKHLEEARDYLLKLRSQRKQVCT